MFDYLLDNYEVYMIVNAFGFIIGLVFGIIAQKNQFCFSGSIKDYIMTNSTRRGASVIMAMIVAIISTAFLTSYYDVDVTSSYYYKQDINYFAIILGGAMFGAGMTIADGCSSRSLIKFAQGDTYSFITVIFIGIFAFATTKGILYEPISFITQNEKLIEFSSLIQNTQINIYIVLAFLFAFLLFLTKKIKRIFTLYDGMLVGLIVPAGWLVTGLFGPESMEREILFSSLSFVYPTGQGLDLFTHYDVNELNFGISIILGLLTGAFVMSKLNRKYSFGCTSSIKSNKVAYNMVGGSLMGMGGVIAIGCTVGQGLTGLSTLAFSSILAVLSIGISGFFTAKYLNKKEKLPLCFVFDWDDEADKKESTEFII